MNKIYIFNEKISIISSSRLAGQGDIERVLGVEKLPDVMKPLLKQEVIPKAALNPLLKLRARARSLILNHSTRNGFFGWIVDPSKTSALVDGLNEIRDQFYSEKEGLLDTYGEMCESHISDLRQMCETDRSLTADGERLLDCGPFIEVVRKAQPQKKYLEDNISFEFLKPKPVDLDVSEAKVIQEGVYGSAIHEIAAKAFAASSLIGVKAKLRVIDEVTRKLSGLGYIEPRLNLIADEISYAMRDVSRDKKNIDYAPTEVLAVCHVIDVIADKQQLIESVENQGSTEEIKGLLHLPSVQVEPVEEVSAESLEDKDADTDVIRNDCTETTEETPAVLW